MFGHQIPLYFMDLNKNKVYLRRQHQKEVLDDFKIGMYFKSEKDAFHP